MRDDTGRSDRREHAEIGGADEVQVEYWFRTAYREYKMQP